MKNSPQRNVTHPAKESDQLTVEEVNDYVISLQQSIRPWFYMHNPYFPMPEYKDELNKQLLDKLHRLSFRAFKPLLFGCICIRSADRKDQQTIGNC